MKKNNVIETNNAKRGGLLKGKLHSEGGMPVVITNAGNKPIEVESEEVVINRRSVQCTDCKHDFDGKQMTNKEILSEINQQGGGVAIYKSGGEVMADGGTISDIDKKVSAFETLLRITKDEDKKQLIKKKLSAFRILAKMQSTKEPEKVKNNEWELSEEEISNHVIIDDKNNKFFIEQVPSGYDIFVLPNGKRKVTKLVHVGKSIEAANKYIKEISKQDYNSLTLNKVIEEKQHSVEADNKLNYQLTLKEYITKRAKDKLPLSPTNAQINGNEYWGKEEHSKFVKRAISEGKSVPKEVLADYPELKINEPVKKEEVNPLEQFEEVIRKSKSVAEAMDKIRKITGVPKSTSDYFYKKYNPTGMLSTDQAFTVMYNEVKGIKDNTVKLGEPIRQLGTGSNVYFETKKYRVNDYEKGVVLNIQSKDSEMPVANIKFDNASDAVKIAKEIESKYPDGVPDALLVEQYVETLKKELLAPKKTTMPVVEPRVKGTSEEEAAIEEYIDELMKYDMKYINEYIRPQLGQESHNTDIRGIVTEEKIKDRIDQIRLSRRVQADAFVKLVREKSDYEKLSGIVTFKENKASRKLFEKLTGISLGNTVSEAKKAVDGYFGGTVAQDYRKAQEDAQKAKKEAYRQDAMDAELNKKVNVNGQIMTWREHYDNEIGKGGTRLSEMTKHGSFPIMQLRHKDKSEFWDD